MFKNKSDAVEYLITKPISSKEPSEKIKSKISIINLLNKTNTNNFNIQIGFLIT